MARTSSRHSFPLFSVELERIVSLPYHFRLINAACTKYDRERQRLSSSNELWMNARNSSPRNYKHANICIPKSSINARNLKTILHNIYSPLIIEKPINAPTIFSNELVRFRQIRKIYALQPCVCTNGSMDSWVGGAPIAGIYARGRNIMGKGVGRFYDRSINVFRRDRVRLRYLIDTVRH